MQPTLSRLLIVIAIHAVAIARVEAEAQSINGVVAIGGNADERDRAAVMVGVMAGIRAAGWRLPAAPLQKRESTGLLRCLEPGEPWACIPRTIGERGVHRALVVSAEKQQADDGSPIVVLSAKLIVTKPHALVIHQRFCEHCTDDKLTQASADLTRQLVQELAVRIGRTVLDVKSIPTGARIVLDGNPIGATDTTFNTYPGSHVVIVDKPGYLTETVNVEAQEDRTAEVSVALRAAGAQPAAITATARPAPRSRILPLTLIGAGGAAVVAGGVLISLGQQDGPDDKIVHTRATTLGVVTGIVGAAALGTGAYLWWRRPRESAPVVGLVPSGAVIGWSRSF